MYSLKVIKMTLSNFELDILNNAVDIFRKTTGLDVDIKQDSHFEPIIRIKYQNNEFCFNVDVKPTINQAMFNINKQFELYRKNQLLITNYATPQMADQLKKMGILFIDLAGNAHINQPPIYIHIKGNKLTKIKKDPVKRLFRPAGLKVLFALLCNPGLEKTSYRVIMKAANVALGTVEIAMKELRELGYLIDLEKNNRKLVRRKKLLTRWVTAYPEQLRPELLKGYYKTEKEDWWTHINLEKYSAKWGGEIAAALITKFYRPKIATIYTNELDNRLLLENKMKKSSQGEIEIIQMFWGFEFNWQFENIVHPILVYADLVASDAPRNVEMAGRIYEQELHRFIQED